MDLSSGQALNINVDFENVLRNARTDNVFLLLRPQIYVPIVKLAGTVVRDVNGLIGRFTNLFVGNYQKCSHKNSSKRVPA